MANRNDQRRAVGGYLGNFVFPRHKPDPTDLSKEYADMQWTPPPMDQATIAAQGPGTYGSVGGGQSAFVAPDPRTAIASGSFLPDPGEGFRPDPNEALREHIRTLPGYQDRQAAFAAGDTPMRQQLAQGEQQYADAMAPQQKLAIEQLLKRRSGGGDQTIFLAALKGRLKNPAIANYVTSLMGQQGGQPQQTTPQAQARPVAIPQEDKPEPVGTPTGLTGLARYNPAQKARY